MRSSPVRHEGAKSRSCLWWLDRLFFHSSFLASRNAATCSRSSRISCCILNVPVATEKKHMGRKHRNGMTQASERPPAPPTTMQMIESAGQETAGAQWLSTSRNHRLDVFRFRVRASARRNSNSSKTWSRVFCINSFAERLRSATPAERASRRFG